jgi:succinyl-CoA synthetase beta subunit
MNLYEFEGKHIFEKYGIAVPRGVVVRRSDDVVQRYRELGITDVVIKAQVLSGKRGKGGGIAFASSEDEVKKSCAEIFNKEIRGQYVAAIRIEEKVAIAEEHYLSITYDTTKKQPVLIYSEAGGMDIEDVPEEKIIKQYLDIRNQSIESAIQLAQKVWECFLKEDARMVEINPLVKTTAGEWISADAKIALDDDAFYRHEEWKNLEPRTMMGRASTDRENEARKIDEGEAYYRGTAGKYIEMDGDIAILFSGGGASIANMDALIKAGLKPANYTEYSGNPPREKVHALAKVVLSKPGLRGLWIAGGVANFTNISETFQGIVDALDEIKPAYPIVVRRAGPFEKEGMELLRECAERNNLRIKLFGKETSMSETAEILARLII